MEEEERERVKRLTRMGTDRFFFFGGGGKWMWLSLAVWWRRHRRGWMMKSGGSQSAIAFLFTHTLVLAGS